MAERNPCKLIGENLKVLRKALGITQVEAAERIDISVSGYREIERGNANPTLRTLELIAEGLGVPPLALIKTPMEAENVQISQAVMLIANAVDKLSMEKREDFLQHIVELTTALWGVPAENSESEDGEEE